MNTNWKITTLSLVAALSLTTVFAQKVKDKEKKKAQSITIVRSGESTEKMVVEIDGDKVTINGKPIEEFKDDDVKVLTNDGNVRMVGPLTGMLPREPFAPRTFNGSDFYSFGGNEAFLGITTETADGGAKVTGVTKESAAEKAGLKEGDVITRIGETIITSASDVYEAIGKQKADDKVSINFNREGKPQTITATLGKNKASARTFALADTDVDFNFGNGQHDVYNFMHSRKPRLGLQIQDVEEGTGAKILDVNDDTPAGKAGLQKDDIITSFNGKDVKGIDDLKAAMKEVKEGDSVPVTYKRGANTQTLQIKFPKAVKKANI